VTADEFERTLEILGITVYSRGGQIAYLAPPGAMTTELRAAALIHRDVLIQMAEAADAALDRELEDEHCRAIVKQKCGALEAAA
jgi:hypothetical protein